jgi:hypothetical protein
MKVLFAIVITSISLADIALASYCKAPFTEISPL